MAVEPQRLTDLERSNLVAYLDGELPQTEADYLRTKITQSVTARREIEALEKTWELLDHLPRPRPTEDLTSRTLTAVELLEGWGVGLEDKAAHVSGIAVRLLACLATCLLTLGLGYAATRWLWPDPSARLIQNLQIAENLEKYQSVGSYEFLKVLDNSPIFNEDAP